MKHRSRLAPLLLIAMAWLCGARAAETPFNVQGPGVRPEDFRITTFATGLDYPLGMGRLRDGSLLVAVSEGRSFGNSTGTVLRFVDANRDGVADDPGVKVYTGLPGGQTSLRIGGDLVFVTGQGRGKPISVLRSGGIPGDELTFVGRININYPTGTWYHPHSALGVRATPGRTNSYDLFFQLGSEANFARTLRTATITSDEIAGVTGTLLGDAIYSLTLTDQTTNVIASNLTRVATGLRNPAGFAFHPSTGDLYFQDNGIDGLVDVNEPTSADELNRIVAANIGGAEVEDFGFPDTYTAYRTGLVVGGAGVPPLVAFQPLPDPLTGSESEGPNDIVFAPRGFPAGLNDGIFLGFHGRYGSAGVTNEENPLVCVNLADLKYFHFLSNDEPNIGHLDGLLTTDDSLFLADLTPKGSLDTGAGLGVIYQIKSLARPILAFRRTASSGELTWTHGVLQEAASASGPWTSRPDAANPLTVPLEFSSRYYRAVD